MIRKILVYLLIALAILISLFFLHFRPSLDEEINKSNTETEKVQQKDVKSNEEPPNESESTSIKVWDPETESLKEYPSYDDYERVEEEIRKTTTEEYNKATKGTVVEQLLNIEVPEYLDTKESGMLYFQDGEIESRGQPSEMFPDGAFLFSVALSKDVNSFTIGDFNNDGLDDVAHMIGETGGGSGYFYYFTIFINEKGKLKFLTQYLLGDRVVIKDVKYDSGVFTIDMITQGEGDNFIGYCCPNVPKTIQLKLEDNKLVKI